MTRLFYPSPAEAVTCRRCGNSTPIDAETCPHCGADHGGMIKSGNAASLPTGLRRPFVAAKGNVRAATPVMSPYPSLPEQSDLIGNHEQRWDRSKTLTLGAIVLAFVVGGVIYTQHGDSDGSATPDQEKGQSVSGSIDPAKLARDAAAAAATAPPVTGNSLGAVQPAARPAPAVVATAPATAVPAPVAQVAPPALAAAPLPAAQQPGVIDNMQAARDAIDRGDLTTARRRFSKIPSAAYESGNVQRTQADLLRAERTRDDKLQAARDCEAVGSWTCVRQNARDVLAVDASNVEAQDMVEQAISRSGWLNGSTGSAPPSPAQGIHVTVTPSPPAARQQSATAVAVPGYAAAADATTRLMPRYGTAPRLHPVAPAGVPAASDQSRVDTGSHVPLTSSYAPVGTAPHSPPPFVPPTVSTEPVAATPRAPLPVPVSAPAQPLPAEVSATPSARADAPVAVNTPQSAPVKPNAFSGATPEDEERAIRENGWKKTEPAKPAVSEPESASE